MGANQGFMDILSHGGVTLVVLVLLSLWSWIIIVERWLKFARAEKGSERLGGRVVKLLRAGQLHEARELSAGVEEGALGRDRANRGHQGAGGLGDAARPGRARRRDRGDL